MNPSMSPEIQQAMARRQMGAPSPQLNQVSPDAAMQNSVPQPMNPSAMIASSAPPAPAGKPSYTPQNQDDMIVSALIEQLGNSHKLKKEQMKMSSGQMSAPQPPPTPTQPMGDSFGQAPSMPTSQMQGGSPFSQSF